MKQHRQVWDKTITELLGVHYPIIQAPMLGVGTPEMVAAAAKAGCLGSLPLGDMAADKAQALIRATKKLTDKPFAVNIFVHPIPAITDSLRTQYDSVKCYVYELAQQHGLEVALPELDSLEVQDYSGLIDVILEEEVKVLSFTFGNLNAFNLQRLKDRGVLLMGTCTSVAEALQLQQSGIDVICVQGIEAGGHRGSFVTADMPEIGGFALLQQVADRLSVPLIYAGGISDAKSLLASKIMGAEGFQVGSLLLASAESALEDFEIQRLLYAQEQDIILTKSFSGRYARGIRNKFTAALDNSVNILPYPYQNKLTAELRRVARNAKNVDFVNIWAGQSLPYFSRQSTSDILLNLIKAVENFTF